MARRCASARRFRRARAGAGIAKERSARRRIRSRVGHAPSVVLLRWSIGGALAGTEGDASAEGGSRAGRSRARGCDRCDGRRAAVDQAAGDVESCGRGVGPPARVTRGRSRTRARRQHRRCRHRRVVRARCRRAGSVGHRRRRHGDALSEGHGRAGCNRLQGSSPEPRDARQPARIRRQRRWRRSGEHSRRRRRHGSAISKLRQQEADVERSDRAGDRIRGEGLRARRGAADVDCRRPAVLREVSRRGPHLPSGRQCAEAGRSLRQQGLRLNAPHDREGWRRCFLSRIDRAANCRRHGEERRLDHRRRSRAVPRHSTTAAVGSVPRSCGVFRAARRCRPARR